MEQPLEHKIKKGYLEKDQNTTFKRKNELWGQISNQLGHSSTGVAAIWRLAAIILAILSFGGVLASVNSHYKSNKRILYIQNQNAELQLKYDSLASQKPKVLTETIIKEKEIIVYREVKTETEKNETIMPKKDDRDALILSLESQLNHAQKNLITIKDSLKQTQKKYVELLAIQSGNQAIKNATFRLKTQMAKDEMQAVKSELTPKMKLQMLKIQDDNIKFDSNTTLFKK